MGMKGQITEIMTSWWGLFVLALIVLGVLAALFGYNLIPDAEKFLKGLLGIGN